MICLRFLSVYLLVLATVTVGRGAVLHNYPQKLVQPDGSVVHCYASGDEFHHWLHDAQNYTIVQDARTGYFVYAVLENGVLSPSGHIVGRSNPEYAGLTGGANIPPDAIRTRREEALTRAGMLPGGAGAVGVINNIVIFIRFADETAGVFPDSIATFDRMFNSAVSGANSMYNYFREVSYDQLSILTAFYPSATAGVVSYSDSHPRDYYRKFNAVTNPAGYTTENDSWAREQAMLANALKALKSQIPAATNIDANNDGYVDNVCFVVSGGAEAWADLLWPHMSTLTYEQVAINGKTVRTYNFQLRNTLLDPGNLVYLLAHEMFHSLGAPDLYHYSYQPPDPVGAWDIMDHSGNPPVHMSAYMKWRYGGWIGSLPTISAPGTYALAPLYYSTNNCYKIPSLYSSKEYFVVEYRRRLGRFESTLPGQGLLVYRVNPDYRGNANGPPDELYLYRPGGTTAANGFPDWAAMNANTGWVALTDSTAPSSFLTDGSPGGLILTGVGYLGDTLSFTIDFPKVPVITLNTRAIYLEPIGDAWTHIDTTIIVWNTGFAQDSVTTSIGPSHSAPDSAIAVSPRSFALAPRDSQIVTIRIRPRLFPPGSYTPIVLVTSRFGVLHKTFSVVMDFEKITSAAAEGTGLLEEFSLVQNYPNPFNATTVVSCHLPVGQAGWPVASNVNLVVCDVLGREVARLADGLYPAGRHSFSFLGSNLATGVYVVRLEARPADGSRVFVDMKKMILVR